MLFLFLLQKIAAVGKLLVVFFISLVAVQGSYNLLISNRAQSRKIYVPPPQYIKHLHFGYAEAMADSFWIRAIQDFDYCENTQDAEVKSEEEILSKDVTVHKKELEGEFSHVLSQITSLNKGLKSCQNGWLAQMLDATTELAPRFKTVYLTGATSLSVILNDFEGASKLFNKGIRQFPDDWRLPYNAAYHFMYDRQDLARAAELLKLAAEKGAPPWVNSLAARAYTASGQGELAIRTLMAFRQYTKGDLTDQVDARIQKIREILLKNQQKEPPSGIPENSKENSP